MSHWIIRSEGPGDLEAIATLVADAFREAPHSNGTEAEIVSRLRHDGDLALSLVATDLAGALLGHAAFSPVLIGGRTSGWHGLGPIAVRPDQQGRGIGSALIGDGLRRLRALGAGGCVVLGEPGYYRRFGFRRTSGLTYPGPPPECFQAQAFGASVPEGEVRYRPAFG